MTTPTYVVACTKNERIARDVHEIRLEKPAGFSFRPGQFVLLDVPLVGNPEDLQPRAYSIASTPEEPDLLFAMKLKAGGRASAWITEELQEGTAVTMKGPFGFFLHEERAPKDDLFVCTGTGVAPFRSYIRSALARGEKRRMDLICGVFAEVDLFWTEEWEALARAHGNFFLHLALSDPSPAWKGHRGWVQSLVPKIVQDFSRKSVCICGNPAMTDDVKKLCLEEWGVPKEDVHAEGYI